MALQENEGGTASLFAALKSPAMSPADESIDERLMRGGKLDGKQMKRKKKDGHQTTPIPSFSPSAVSTFTLTPSVKPEMQVVTTRQPSAWQITFPSLALPSAVTPATLQPLGSSLPSTTKEGALNVANPPLYTANEQPSTAPYSHITKTSIPSLSPSHAKVIGTNRPSSTPYSHVTKTSIPTPTPSPSHDAKVLDSTMPPSNSHSHNPTTVVSSLHASSDKPAASSSFVTSTKPTTNSSKIPFEAQIGHQRIRVSCPPQEIEGIEGQSIQQSLSVARFSYELETVAGASMKAVIVGVENAMTKGVANELLLCEVPARRLDDLSSLIAVDSFPADVLNNEETCNSKSESNKCAVIDGALTAISRDATGVETDAIITFVEQNIDNGGFAFPSDVIRVTYRPRLAKTTANPQEPYGSDFYPGRNNFYAVAMVTACVLAASSFLVLVVLKFWSQRTAELMDRQHADSTCTAKPSGCQPEHHCSNEGNPDVEEESHAKKEGMFHKIVVCGGHSVISAITGGKSSFDVSYVSYETSGSIRSMSDMGGSSVLGLQSDASYSPDGHQACTDSPVDSAGSGQGASQWSFSGAFA